MSIVVNAKRLKAGDHFVARVTVKRQGVAVDLTSVTITSQVRRRDKTLVSGLTITPTNLAAGQFTVSGATGAWPLGQLLWDIQFIENSIQWSMPTRGILVEDDVTS